MTQASFSQREEGLLSHLGLLITIKVGTVVVKSFFLHTELWIRLPTPATLDWDASLVAGWAGGWAVAFDYRKGKAIGNLKFSIFSSFIYKCTMEPAKCGLPEMKKLLHSGHFPPHSIALVLFHPFEIGIDTPLFKTLWLVPNVSPFRHSTVYQTN